MFSIRLIGAVVSSQSDVDAHLELARAMFAAVAAGDRAGLETMLAAEYALHDASVPEQTTRADFFDQLEQIRERYVDPQFILQDVFGTGDRVCVRWTLAGDCQVRSPTGELITHRLAHDGISILRIHSGQIAEEWASYDELGLQRQIAELRALG